ncbi:MAG: hypothetical protein AABX47_03280 [Nanoarchaeota archaeon]
MIYDPAIWERLFGFLAGLLELSICAVFGAVIGAAYSMWLAYDAQGVVRPDWRRLAVSVICSALFGGFAAALLAEFNIVSMGKILGAEGVAILGGVLGPHLMDKIPKSFGLDGFRRSFDRIPYDLNERQRKALDYARTLGAMGNDDYQKLNSVSDSTAERELSLLCKKGFLKRSGKTKGIKYQFV